MLYSTKQEEGTVLPKHLDLTVSELMASADGGRSKRQMVNITSNIFILLSKAKQKINAYEATQDTKGKHPFYVRKQQAFWETWS